LITRSQALLWTDGRYHNQASKELSSDWTLMRSGVNGVPTLAQWLVQNITAGKTVGVDASLISAAVAHDLINSGVSLVPIGE
jgi:Xaa-Pro aminopeptidase